MKHPVDELLQHLYGMSDDQLLQEFKAAEMETENEGGTQPDLEGLQRLWEKMKQEYENGGNQ